MIQRAIVVNMTMESGKRCSATFDRYGMNSGLFDKAHAEGWDDQRTINQAISEALSGALRTYPGDKPANFNVATV